jgi:Domain of unknown function (DUF1707)
MRCRWEPPYPGGGRRSTSSSNLRASDAERNEVADRLARHFADGRLDQTEFKARLDRAMGATTRGDLEGLFDDLPPLPTEVTPPARWHRRVVPLVAVVVLVAVAAGATVPSLQVVRFPWVALAAVAAFVWLRTSRHRHTGPFTGVDNGR